MAVLGTSMGNDNPSGASQTIDAAISIAAAVGDLVIVAYCWAVDSNSLDSVSDTQGNTWNVVSTPAPAKESGGYAWTIVTNAWSSTTVTGALASGTPGGRCWAAMKIAAANLAASPLDRNTQGVAAGTSKPSLATPAGLAQASESIILVALVREGGTTVPTWTTPTPSGAAVVASATGVGTVTSGVAILEYDNTVGAAAVTMGFTAASSSGDHGLGIVAFKGATGGGGGAAATSSAEIGYQSIDLVYDDQLYNQALSGRDGGDTFQIDDTDSQAEFGSGGARSFDATGLILESDLDAQRVGQTIVDRFSGPAYRIDSITLNGATPGALTHILQREIGDWIRVRRRGTGGTPIDIITQIIGKQKSFDPHGNLVCTWNLARGFNAGKTGWRLGMTGFSELGSTTVLG